MNGKEGASGEELQKGETRRLGATEKQSQTTNKQTMYFPVVQIQS